MRNEFASFPARLAILPASGIIGAMSTPCPVSASEAAARLEPVDRLGIPLGPGQPKAFLHALGQRDDWEDLAAPEERDVLRAAAREVDAKGVLA